MSFQPETSICFHKNVCVALKIVRYIGYYTQKIEFHILHISLLPPDQTDIQYLRYAFRIIPDLFKTSRGSIKKATIFTRSELRAVEIRALHYTARKNGRAQSTRIHKNETVAGSRSLVSDSRGHRPEMYFR